MDCWVWDKGKLSAGYGTTRIEGVTKLVHRIAYEYIIGAIPNGLELDHLCRNHACYNPEHLEAVTHIENMRRGKHARKTHCPNGHPYSGDNLYIGKQTKGGTVARVCKTCRRESCKAWRKSPRYEKYRKATKVERMKKQREYRKRQCQEAQEGRVTKEG